MSTMTVPLKRLSVLVAFFAVLEKLCTPYCHGASLSSISEFHGVSLQSLAVTIGSPSASSSRPFATITMRKQKASDRRTRRMQRGGVEDLAQDLFRDSFLRQNLLTKSPMAEAGGWKQKRRNGLPPSPTTTKTILGSATVIREERTGGRGRSRKRSLLYNSLSAYYNKFLHLLTTEYRAEVSF